MIWYLRIMIYIVKMLYTHTQKSRFKRTHSIQGISDLFLPRQNESDLVTDFVAETHSREV